MIAVSGGPDWTGIAAICAILSAVFTAIIIPAAKYVRAGQRAITHDETRSGMIEVLDDVVMPVLAELQRDLDSVKAMVNKHDSKIAYLEGFNKGGQDARGKQPV